MEVTKELSQVNAESIDQIIQPKYNTVKKILDFIDGWRTDKKDISPTGKLSDEQIAQFVKDLHGEIEKMDLMPQMPKISLYIDASGVLQEGTEPLKPTIVRGLDGTLKMGDAIAQEAVEQAGKGAIKDFVR